MNADNSTLREQALAEGYKDEVCPKCGTLFEAQIHLVRCDARPCPMISTTDPRTLFERMMDGTKSASVNTTMTGTTK